MKIFGFMKSTQSPALNSKHSIFSQCVEVKLRKDPRSQQSRARLRALKITASTLQGQRSANTLFSVDEKKPCRELSLHGFYLVREPVTASILGTAPLWVTEPSMRASTPLTNSPIPINHTEHLVSVSAAREGQNEKQIYSSAQQLQTLDCSAVNILICSYQSCRSLLVQSHQKNTQSPSYTFAQQAVLAGKLTANMLPSWEHPSVSQSQQLSELLPCCFVLFTPPDNLFSNLIKSY